VLGFGFWMDSRFHGNDKSAVQDGRRTGSGAPRSESRTGCAGMTRILCYLTIIVFGVWVFEVLGYNKNLKYLDFLREKLWW